MRGAEMSDAAFLNTFLGSVQHYVGIAVARNIEGIVEKALDEAVAEAASHLNVRLYEEYRRGQRDGFRRGIEAKKRVPRRPMP